MCNELLKFGKLWAKARDLGCDYIATGHYAIVGHDAGAPVLRKGRDPRKDQSYFLFSLGREQLSRALFPLGAMTKPEIREIARQLGLRVAEKQDSQEICFVPGNDYKEFLRSHMDAGEFHPGGIYDTQGNFLGKHDGIELFTIGQRKGLPGGSPRPLYVVDIDPATASVIVGGDEDLLTEEFEADRVNWLAEDFTGPVEATVKIRYAHTGVASTLSPLGGDRVLVRMREPQRAVTPGQAAVFYDGDRVLGGGWIVRHAKVAAPASLQDSLQ
jgi:tRNA-specific 2-thiouridylase